jgi:ABC-type nitrate/sulfonate/bicarbonate transport system ATPase subunit
MRTTLEAPSVEPQPSSTGSDLAVAAREVRFSFGELAVLDGLDLRVGPTEVVGLVGPSGCGKSTFLELVAGLRSPQDGTLEVHGEREDEGRLRGCAYMPQSDLLLPWLAAVDNAALALRNRGVRRQAAREAAEPLLREFGLEGFEAAKPHELSGGMRQRVAFARTVLAGKPVLLLDEPFGGLDAITRAEMQEWLAGALAESACATLLVTHDVEEALYLCDRVAILAPRPTNVVAELAGPSPRAHPRDRVVTSHEFVSARERALAALRPARR